MSVEQDLAPFLHAIATRVGVVLTPAEVDGPPDAPSLRTLGTGPNQAASGDDPRFNAVAPPTDGPALTPSLRTLGTGPLQAAAGDDVRFNAISPPTDAAAGVGSLRTLGSGPLQAAPGDDARFTHAIDGMAATPSLRTLGVGAQQAAAGNDARFTHAIDGAAGVASLRTLGTGALQAAAGNDSRFTPPPTDGTAGTPSLRTLGTGAQQAAAGNDARFAALAPPTDGTAATPSLRTLGTGAQQAAAGDDARFTQPADAAAGVASLRTLGTGSLQAAAGDDSRFTQPADAAAGVASLRTLGTGALQAAAGNDARFGVPTSGTAAGDLAGTYPNPEVAAIHETSGPTQLTFGAIADGEFVKRVGSTLVGAAAGGSSDHKVAITGADTTADYLNAKISGSSGITLSVLNPGANEVLQIAGPAALPPNGSAGGDLSGSYPSPAVVALTESAGPTSLPLGAIANGQILARVGANIIGIAPPAPSGTAGGQLGGTYPNPSVIALTETSGPTGLVLGSIADGLFLKRVGSTIVGAAASGGTSLGASGEKLITPTWAAGKDDNDNTVEKVIGVFSFDPSQFTLTGTTKAITLRTVAAVGNATVTGYVKLRDVSSGVDIHTFSFTGGAATTAAEVTQTLTTGVAAAGVITNAPTLYEVRIYVNGNSVVSDFIQHWKTEIRITNTVI